MSITRLLRTLLNVTRLVVEEAYFEAGGRVLVVRARPYKKDQLRCPHCNKRSDYYDEGRHGWRARRRWRSLDLGTLMTYIEARAPRVRCARHGVVVASVPWARHGSWFTYDFEQQVAWLCVHSCRSVVASVMRIDWKSVGPVCSRAYKELEARLSPSRLDGLTRIGIDETSYKKGHKYLTTVVDHDRGRVVWVGKGYGKAVLEGFFSLLTDEQKKAIQLVSADGARWVADIVADECPGAGLVMDPFHVVGWATDALDELRRREWRRAKEAAKDAPRHSAGRPKKGEERAPDTARAIKGLRYPLLKNPEHLTTDQQARLELAMLENDALRQGYVLKEGLRLIFKMTPDAAGTELDLWLERAACSGIDVFEDVGKKVGKRKGAVLAAIESGISNARVEAMNNKIKLIVRRGYGFRNIDNLMALVMLCCSSLPLVLPGRQA